MSESKQAVFIHSLFRSGSTYVLNVFRRSAGGYWCYQEPLNEIVLLAKKQKEILLTEKEDKILFLRHPKLDKPYFFELHEVAENCLPYLTQKSLYYDYFSQEIPRDFFSSLIKEARGKPLVQECRTSSRIEGIKSQIGGYHIYLWRNPWDQWWSYKISDYFSAVNQMIINTPNVPKVIDKLRKEISFTPCPKDDLLFCVEWFKKHKLSPENSYLVFYVLWFLGLKHGKENADILLNIDELSNSGEYRKTINDELKNNKIDNLDFSDCSIPQALYTQFDVNFFSEIEDQARGLLLLSGVSSNEIDDVFELHNRYKPESHKTKRKKAGDGLVRDAERARNLVLQRERDEAASLIELFSLRCDLEISNTSLREKEQNIIETQQYLVELERELSRKNEIIEKAELHTQWLQTEWDSTKAKLDSVFKELAQYKVWLKLSDEKILREQEHAQWLQESIEDIKSSLEKTSVQLLEKTTLLEIANQELSREMERNQWLQTSKDDIKSDFEKISAQLFEKNALLEIANQGIFRENEHNRWLQKEWTTSQNHINIVNEQLVRQMENIEKKEGELVSQYAHSQWLKNEWDASKNLADSLRRELEYIYSSKSWVFTSPFRVVLKGAKWLVQSFFSWFYAYMVNKPKSIAKKGMQILRYQVSSRPRVRIFVIRVIKPFPKFRAWITKLSAFHEEKSVVSAHLSFPSGNVDGEQVELPTLSLRAKEIYIKLEQAIQKRER